MFGMNHRGGRGVAGRGAAHAWQHAMGMGPEWGFAPGPGRGGGRRRMFDGRELRLVLLSLIAQTPRHGYDLIRAIEDRTGGAYAPSPGVVYPTLTMLDEMGLIGERKVEGAKKQFAITADGEAYLARHAEEVAAVLARLDALGEQRARGEATPVRRAVANLKAVLQHRLHGVGEPDADLVHRIAAEIDAAAQRIERL